MCSSDLVPRLEGKRLLHPGLDGGIQSIEGILKTLLGGFVVDPPQKGPGLLPPALSGQGQGMPLDGRDPGEKRFDLRIAEAVVGSGGKVVQRVYVGLRPGQVVAVTDREVLLARGSRQKGQGRHGLRLQAEIVHDSVQDQAAFTKIAGLPIGRDQQGAKTK